MTPQVIYQLSIVQEREREREFIFCLLSFVCHLFERTLFQPNCILAVTGPVYLSVVSALHLTCLCISSAYSFQELVVLAHSRDKEGPTPEAKTNKKEKKKMSIKMTTSSISRCLCTSVVAHFVDFSQRPRFW